MDLLENAKGNYTKDDTKDTDLPQTPISFKSVTSFVMFPEGLFTYDIIALGGGVNDFMTAVNKPQCRKIVTNIKICVTSNMDSDPLRLFQRGP